MSAERKHKTEFLWFWWRTKDCTCIFMHSKCVAEWSLGGGGSRVIQTALAPNLYIQGSIELTQVQLFFYRVPSCVESNLPALSVLTFRWMHVNERWELCVQSSFPTWSVYTGGEYEKPNVKTKCGNMLPQQVYHTSDAHLYPLWGKATVSCLALGIHSSSRMPSLSLKL